MAVGDWRERRRSRRRGDRKEHPVAIIKTINKPQKWMAATASAGPAPCTTTNGAHHPVLLCQSISSRTGCWPDPFRISVNLSFWSAFLLFWLLSSLLYSSNGLFFVCWLPLLTPSPRNNWMRSESADLLQWREERRGQLLTQQQRKKGLSTHPRLTVLNLTSCCRFSHFPSLTLHLHKETDHPHNGGGGGRRWHPFVLKM